MHHAAKLNVAVLWGVGREGEDYSWRSNSDDCLISCHLLKKEIPKYYISPNTNYILGLLPFIRFIG